MRTWSKRNGRQDSKHDINAHLETPLQTRLAYTSKNFQTRQLSGNDVTTTRQDAFKYLSGSHQHAYSWRKLDMKTACTFSKKWLPNMHMTYGNSTSSQSWPASSTGSKHELLCILWLNFSRAVNLLNQKMWFLFIILLFFFLSTIQQHLQYPQGFAVSIPTIRTNQQLCPLFIFSISIASINHKNKSISYLIIRKKESLDSFIGHLKKKKRSFVHLFLQRVSFASSKVSFCLLAFFFLKEIISWLQSWWCILCLKRSLDTSAQTAAGGGIGDNSCVTLLAATPATVGVTDSVTIC